jgi:chromosome segregation ATPase
MLPLTNLKSQLKKVEKQIENARRTNIFGRPQSGNDERERDRLIAEIAEIQDKIAHNES